MLCLVLCWIDEESPVWISQILSLVLYPANSAHFDLPGLSTMSFTQGVFPALPGFLSSKQPPWISLMTANWDNRSLTSFVSYVSGITDLHWLVLTVIKTLFNLFIFSDFLLVSSGRLDPILVASSWPEPKVYEILFSSNLWMTKLINLITLEQVRLWMRIDWKDIGQCSISSVGGCQNSWILIPQICFFF